MKVNGKIFAWGFALLLLASLARMGVAMRDMRHARGSGHAVREEGVPPALNAVMMGLGGFRGILAEVLWFRMARLQMQGRYLEITQLADWITRLDPNATEAWVYNAWNLAYNVSAMMRDPADRLRWVANGIILLRNDALAWNPGEPKLFRELAWMYQNKIGSPLDRAHLLYKFSLAAQMAPLLEPNGTVAENLTAAAIADFRALRLDPAFMRELQKRFGPLDWRMPETHALYWSMAGLACAVTDNDALSLRREAYLSLFNACLQNGLFAGDLEAGVWSAAPNPGLADGTEKFLRETIEKFPRDGVSNIYTRFLAHRIRSATIMDTRVHEWHERLNRLAPSGASAIPLEVLRGAPDMPQELFMR